MATAKTYSWEKTKQAAINKANPKEIMAYPFKLHQQAHRGNDNKLAMITKSLISQANTTALHNHQRSTTEMNKEVSLD